MNWWVASEGRPKDPEALPPDGVLLAEVASISDPPHQEAGRRACWVASRWGWLEHPVLLVPKNGDYAGERWQGEQLIRWVRVSEMVRDGLRVLAGAEHLIGRSMQQVDRQVLLDRRKVATGALSWTFGRQAVTVVGAARELEHGRVIPADEDLGWGSLLALQLRLWEEAQGNVSLGFSPPGMLEPQPLNLYGAILLALGREVARVLVGSGQSKVRRCSWCQSAMPYRRSTKKWCSERCRSAAGFSRMKAAKTTTRRQGYGSNAR